MSAQSCDHLAKKLTHHLQIDWDTVLTYVSALAFQEYRKGEPVYEIGKPPDDMKVRYQLEPILERGQVTTIFGPGGSMKTYLADFFATLINYGYTALNSNDFGLLPESTIVLYLDWESGRENHERRVWAIKRSLGIENTDCFYYRFCTQPLVNDIQAIQKLVVEYGIGFVIIDSQMAASGYGPDPAMQATQFYNALRSLRCTCLVLDHVSKESWSGSGTESTGPYGSVVKYNRSRSVWEVKKTQEPGDDFVELSLKHIKHNEGKLNKPVGIRVRFTEDQEGQLESVNFQIADISGNPILGKTLPMKERLISALKPRDKEVKELAEELGSSEDIVRARLNQYKQSFFHYTDGWGLLNDHHQ